MKKTILLLLFSLLLMNSMYSQTVMQEEAKLIAKNFYYERVNQYFPTEYKDIEISEIFTINNESTPVYYAINIKPNAFVIVSATKKVSPILAYSFSSNYSEQDQPPQFSAWVEQYKKQIIHAIEHVYTIPTNITNEWDRLSVNTPNMLSVLSKEKEIEPLLYSTWDQGNYYNQMCPDDPAGPGGHCLTGCVATAMGQLCYYFRWPDVGVGSYSYDLPDYGTISASFEDTEYDWEAMSNEANEPNLAIAELIFHMGVSVDMDYGPDGSGMWNHSAANSLKAYFKYSPETVYLYRDSTNIDWDSTIVAHLDQKIPMYYAGWSVPNVNGHGFICDGYQGEDFFHFNWGWGGSLDGYFYLDELSPGGNNFNLAQELIINAFPDTINYTYPEFCEGQKTLTSLSGSIEDGSSQIYNYENGADCSWLISPQTTEDSVSFITIDFHYFETEYGLDEVLIYDGSTTDDPLLGTFSGSELPSSVVSTGNEILIKFLTDGSNNAQGWFLTYHADTPVWCSGLQNLSAQTGTITDGSYNFNYHNNSTCMWNIDPESGGSVVLLFSELDTEEGKDFVKVYDAETSQLLGEYSGTYGPGSLPEPVISPSGRMFVTFSSNSTVTHAGWSAEYTFELDIAENIAESNVIIFPNPAKEKVQVQIYGIEEGIINLMIKAVNGDVVLTKQVFHNGGNLITEFNTSEISPGIYILSVETSNQTIHRKLVINR